MTKKTDRLSPEDIARLASSSAAPSIDDDRRARGRGYKRERSRILDSVNTIQINFRLEAERAAKIKYDCVVKGLTQEEFFDAILREAGY